MTIGFWLLQISYHLRRVTDILRYEYAILQFVCVSILLHVIERFHPQKVHFSVDVFSGAQPVLLNLHSGVDVIDAAEGSHLFWQLLPRCQLLVVQS